jgi:hypothetical protein
VVPFLRAWTFESSSPKLTSMVDVRMVVRGSGSGASAEPRVLPRRLSFSSDRRRVFISRNHDVVRPGSTLVRQPTEQADHCLTTKVLTPIRQGGYNRSST